MGAAAVALAAPAAMRTSERARFSERRTDVGRMAESASLALMKASDGTHNVEMAEPPPRADAMVGTCTMTRKAMMHRTMHGTALSMVGSNAMLPDAIKYAWMMVITNLIAAAVNTTWNT